MAQRSAIDAFAFGIDQVFKSAVLDEVGKGLRSQGQVDEKAVNSVVDAVAEGMNSYSDRNHFYPTLRTIGVLGISNLCKFADFLVHLQAFKSAAGEGEATVGGHIESLVITPERGVRWRNRISTEVHGIEDSGHAFE